MIGECISPSLPGIKATSSNFCEEVFSSAKEHTEELDTHNIDVILQDQDVRQRHHMGKQNRNEECYYGEDLTDDFDEGQYIIQWLSFD